AAGPWLGRFFVFLPAMVNHLFDESGLTGPCFWLLSPRPGGSSSALGGVGMLQEKLRSAASMFVVLTFLVMGSGCATVTGGARDQNVKITSNPLGATVLVDGQPVGQTPADVKLCRKTEHNVEIAYPGFESAQMTIHRKLNPWLFGNILVGGPLGLVVDICTDATHNLSPDEIHLQLKNGGSDTRAQASGNKSEAIRTNLAAN